MCRDDVYLNIFEKLIKVELCKRSGMWDPIFHINFSAALDSGISARSGHPNPQNSQTNFTIVVTAVTSCSSRIAAG